MFVSISTAILSQNEFSIAEYLCLIKTYESFGRLLVLLQIFRHHIEKDKLISASRFWNHCSNKTSTRYYILPTISRHPQRIYTQEKRKHFQPRRVNKNVVNLIRSTRHNLLIQRRSIYDLTIPTG